MLILGCQRVVLLASKLSQQRCFSLLSSLQVEKYNENGCIVPPWKLNQDDLSLGQNALVELLQNNRNVSPELLVNSHLADGESAAEGVRGSAKLLELASNPQLVSMVGQCLGTNNVILWACQVFCKPPKTGKSVPYHQDGQYWPIVPLRAISAWIALDKKKRQISKNIQQMSSSTARIDM